LIGKQYLYKMKKHLKHIIREEIQNILFETYTAVQNGTMITPDDGYHNKPAFEFDRDPGNESASVSVDKTFYAVDIVNGSTYTNTDQTGKTSTYYKIQNANIIQKHKFKAFNTNPTIIDSGYRIRNYILYKDGSKIGVWDDIQGKFIKQSSIPTNDTSKTKNVDISKFVDIVWNCIIKNLNHMKSPESQNGSIGKHNIYAYERNRQKSPKVANPGWFAYQNIGWLYGKTYTDDLPIKITGIKNAILNIARYGKMKINNSDIQQKTRQLKKIQSGNLTLQQMFYLLHDLEKLGIGLEYNKTNLKQFGKIWAELKKNFTDTEIQGYDGFSSRYIGGGYTSPDYPIFNSNGRDLTSGWCYGYNYAEGQYKKKNYRGLHISLACNRFMSGPAPQDGGIMKF
jgi:hypothetical protein